MGLVTGLDILRAARDGAYGVGAFNTNDMEITQAIVEAAEETRSPVIVSLSEGALKFGGPTLVEIVSWPKAPACRWRSTSTTARATRHACARFASVSPR